MHISRYYGVFANRHQLRPHIVPSRFHPQPRQGRLFDSQGRLPVPEGTPLTRPTDELARFPSPSRIAWAQLLARVFPEQVARCQLCGGKLRACEAVLEPERIASLLYRPRGPPELEVLGQQTLFNE